VKDLVQAKKKKKKKKKRPTRGEIKGRKELEGGGNLLHSLERAHNSLDILRPFLQGQGIEGEKIALKLKIKKLLKIVNHHMTK